MATTKAPESPLWLIILGGALGLLGVLGLSAGEPTGISAAVTVGLLWLGSILALTGIVGVGVTMGMRRADYLIRVRGD